MRILLNFFNFTLMHKNTILAILLIASPILFVLVAYPDTINMSWNQGRGGFLFGLAFIVAEIVGIKFVVSKKPSYFWNSTSHFYNYLLCSIRLWLA